MWYWMIPVSPVGTVLFDGLPFTIHFEADGHSIVAGAIAQTHN